MKHKLKVINLIGTSGSGKAQPLHSKIKTPTGWITMGEAQIGQSVLTPSGQVANIVSVNPQGIKDIYEVIFHDGSRTQCCLDHLWECYFIPINQKTTKKTSTNNNAYWNASGVSIKHTISLKDIIALFQSKSHLKNKINISIDLIKCDLLNDDNKVDLFVDPYLMGAYLGDGNFGGRAKSICITSIDDHIISKINTTLLEGYQLNKRGYTISYSLSRKDRVDQSINKYVEEFTRLGMGGLRSNDKYIPEIYLMGSNQQKLQLIQGLMDTDGTVSNRGECSFTTTSEQMARQIRELLWSFGCTCTTYSRISFYKKDGIRINGQRAFTLRFNHPQKSIFFTLERKVQRIKSYSSTQFRRKISSIVHVGEHEAKCITVSDPSGLYVTDDYIITHNSTTASGLFHQLNQRPLKIEIVNEHAKKMVWAKEHPLSFENQLYITAKQHNKQLHLEQNDIEWCITDSPLILGHLYTPKDYYKGFAPLLDEIWNSFNNFNFLLKRTHFAYDPTGRNQTEEQSNELHSALVDILDARKIPYYEINSSFIAHEEIIRILERRECSLKKVV